MSIEEIPKSYKYTCDICGETHVQRNANGHYTNSTPQWWLTVRRASYDKAPTEALLCKTCAAFFEEHWVELLGECRNPK